MLPTLPSLGRAWHCSSGQPEARTLWSHDGGTGDAGKAQGPWVQGARGWGSTRLGGPTAPLPCKPLPAPAHSLTRTHIHTIPPGTVPAWGAQGTFSTAPRGGLGGSGQDQGHIQTRSPSSPTPLWRQEQAGAGGAGTGDRQGGHRVRPGEAGSQLRFILGSWRGVMLME